MYHGKIISERGEWRMEKFFKKYGIILLLYLVIVGGVLLLNARMRLLNEINVTTIQENLEK